MLIERSQRKTVSIIIKNDGEVLVKVPYGMSDGEIARIVESKKDWIAKKSIGIRSLREAYKDISEFSACLFFGSKQKVLYHSASRTVFDKINSTVYVPQSKPVKESLKVWYKKTAKSILKAKLDELSALLSLPYGALSFTSATGKWGSCNIKAKIILNYRLVMLPEYLMDYVIVHELMHTKALNHSKLFWTSMCRIIPDCKRRAIDLKNYAPLMQIYDN